MNEIKTLVTDDEYQLGDYWLDDMLYDVTKYGLVDDGETDNYAKFNKLLTLKKNLYFPFKTTGVYYFSQNPFNSSQVTYKSDMGVTFKLGQIYEGRKINNKNSSNCIPGIYNDKPMPIVPFDINYLFNDNFYFSNGQSFLSNKDLADRKIMKRYNLANDVIDDVPTTQFQNNDSYIDVEYGFCYVNDSQYFEGYFDVGGKTGEVGVILVELDNPNKKQVIRVTNSMLNCQFTNSKNQNANLYPQIIMNDLNFTSLQYLKVSARKIDDYTAQVYFNDIPFQRIVTKYKINYIGGFSLLQQSGANQRSIVFSYSFSNYTIRKYNYPIYCYLYGDSIISGFGSNNLFENYLHKQLFGIFTDVKINNRSEGGWTVAQVLSRMQSDKSKVPNNAPIILNVGWNDYYSNTDYNQFKESLKNIFTLYPQNNFIVIGIENWRNDGPSQMYNITIKRAIIEMGWQENREILFINPANFVDSLREFSIDTPTGAETYPINNIYADDTHYNAYGVIMLCNRIKNGLMQLLEPIK